MFLAPCNHMMQIATSSTMTVSTSALLAMTRFCVFGRSVNCVVLASFLSSCLVFGGGGLGAVESWITVTQRLGNAATKIGSTSKTGTFAPQNVH